MKYYGKEKCRILKEIRAEIARANDIEWVVSECKHKGNCKGTCPKCEQEVRQLEEALAKREALGKTVAVVGISASIALSVSGCINPFPEPTAGVPVDGGMMPPDTDAENVCTAIAGEMLPPETESNVFDEIMGDIALPGEVVEITSEPEDELMGEPAWEGEYIEEITEEERTEDEITEPEENVTGDMSAE